MGVEAARYNTAMAYKKEEDKKIKRYTTHKITLKF